MLRFKPAALLGPVFENAEHPDRAMRMVDFWNFGTLNIFMATYLAKHMAPQVFDYTSALAVLDSRRTERLFTPGWRAYRPAASPTSDASARASKTPRQRPVTRP